MLFKDIEIKRSDVSATTGKFSCYASTFGGPPDEDNDIIEAGAFAAALALHKSRNTMPALLYQHSHDDPIGTWTSFKEDEVGLYGEGRFTLGVKRGAEAAALLADGALSFSIGFSIAPGGQRTENGIRYISKIARLVEVSAVTFPANPKAKVTTRKDAEAQMRQAFGLSRREARKMVAHARDLERNGRVSTLEPLVDALQQLTTEINRGDL